MLLHTLTDEEVEILVGCLRHFNFPVMTELADKIAQDRADARKELTEHAGVIQAARDEYESDDLEIDDEPIIAKAEKGIWVNAWVWVPFSDPEDEEEDDDGHS